MNLCSDGHDEVCFEGRICPLCHMRDEMNEEIDTLREQVESLEAELEEKE